MVEREAVWEKYNEGRPRGDIDRKAAFDAGWKAAAEAAADIADNWHHRGDPAIAMYASPRIRDQIKARLR